APPAGRESRAPPGPWLRRRRQWSLVRSTPEDCSLRPLADGFSALCSIDRQIAILPPPAAPNSGPRHRGRGRGRRRHSAPARPLAPRPSCASRPFPLSLSRCVQRFPRGGPRRACRSDSTPDAPPKKPRREPRIVDPRPPHVAPSQARATRASPAVAALRAPFPQGPSANGLPERLDVAAVGATRLPERLNAAAVGATRHPPPAARHALSTGPVGLHRHTPTPRFAGSGGQAG